MTYYAFLEINQHTAFKMKIMFTKIWSLPLFYRSEIDRLTELLHSRTTESSYRDKEKTSEGDLYKSVSNIEKQNLSTRGPLQENRDDGIKLHNFTATGVSSKVR